jgi:hypothetical protein
MKSKIIIFSSSEGLKVARKIQKGLQYNSEPTIWSQGLFKLSQTSINSILDGLSNAECSVVLLTPDDSVEVRGESYKIARSNVIFELGLSIGKLGLANTFLVKPKNIDIRKITDLEGIIPCVYDSEREDRNFEAALGPVCDEIIDAVHERGIASFKNKLLTLLNEINPDIISWHQSGHKSVSITLNSRTEAKLFSLQSYNSQYFNRLVTRFQPNYSFVSGLGGTIGSILRDMTGGAMNGFELALHPELYKLQDC